MRKIFLFQNVSLDGYFEGPGHDISGFKNDFEAFPAGPDQAVDALLFGHRTYEMMKFWSTPQAVDTMPEVAKFMNETLKIVASHAPFEPGWKNVRVISGDVIGSVRALKAGPGKDMIMFGSNALCVSLLQAGLMDELQIVVNPVVFGGGTPLFQGLDKKMELELALVDTRRFKSGAVMLRYTPTPPM